MNNLLAGTGVGTAFADMRLHILRFTPTATRVINLIPGDGGWPLGHIVSNLVSYDTLLQDAQAMLDSLVPIEHKVQTEAGTWYLMRIRPYRTLENAIEGVVLTSVDISRLKRAEAAQREAQALAESIVDAVHEPLLVLDENMRIVSANRAFYRTFHVQRDETVGQVLHELGNRQWDIPALRQLLEAILSQSTTFDDFEVSHEFERFGPHRAAQRPPHPWRYGPDPADPADD
jgi:two-component system CheB/CheR fusion protein